MRRVLLVDRQPHILRVVKMGLDGPRYAVDVARDGLQALELLRLHRYDVLITDVQMPRMSGTELCEAMHSELAPPFPHTLLVTASTAADLRDWVRQRPHTELLEKPISLRRLKQQLDELFEPAPACVATD